MSVPSLCTWFSFFFFSSRRRHTRFDCDWSSDVCSSDLPGIFLSCLRGSELHHLQAQRLGRFLSCLRGSERCMKTKTTSERFLSCLRGSEIGRASCRERV